jgi:hypothetical protein
MRAEVDEISRDLKQGKPMPLAKFKPSLAPKTSVLPATTLFSFTSTLRVTIYSRDERCYNLAMTIFLSVSNFSAQNRGKEKLFSKFNFRIVSRDNELYAPYLAAIQVALRCLIGSPERGEAEIILLVFIASHPSLFFKAPT